MRAIWAGLTDGERATYGVYIAHCNGKTSMCRLQPATVARESGKSRATVNRARRSLRDKGLIRFRDPLPGEAVTDIEIVPDPHGDNTCQGKQASHHHETVLSHDSEQPTVSQLRDRPSHLEGVTVSSEAQTVSPSRDAIEQREQNEQKQQQKGGFAADVVDDIPQRREGEDPEEQAKVDALGAVGVDVAKVRQHLGRHSLLYVRKLAGVLRQKARTNALDNATGFALRALEAEPWDFGSVDPALMPPSPEQAARHRQRAEQDQRRLQGERRWVQILDSATPEHRDRIKQRYLTFKGLAKDQGDGFLRFIDDGTPAEVIAQVLQRCDVYDAARRQFRPEIARRAGRDA